MLGDRIFNLIVCDYNCIEFVVVKRIILVGGSICRLLIIGGGGGCGVNRCGEERRCLVRGKEVVGGMVFR